MLTSGRGRRTVAYRGDAFTITFALTRDLESPALTFYEELGDTDKAKMLVLFRLLGDRGQIQNREKFKKLEDDVWEFKSHQIRMPCAFLSNKVVVITHGFFKKANDVPPAEIKRAKRRLSEDAEVAKS